jgi:hypothetical protein
MHLVVTKGVMAALIVGMITPTSLTAEDKILEEVKAGHRAARQSIRTFSASVLGEKELPQRTTMDTGRYWRAGDLVRIQRGKEGDWTADYLVKDGEIREVYRNQWTGGRVGFHKARRTPATDFLSGCDVWREMLIDHCGPEGGQIAYDRLLELAQVTTTTKYERRENRQYAKVSLSYSSRKGFQTRLVLWHDVGCNYLIRKIDVAFPGTDKTSVGTITEFAEPDPGVFVPLGCRWEYYEKGKFESSRLTTLSDVQVNKPIQPSIFTLPAIPSGTLLDDSIEGTRGLVGSDWRPIGRREPFKTQQPVPTLSSSVYDAPSTREPASAGWWVTVASCAVLAAALSYLIFRRIRPAPE